MKEVGGLVSHILEAMLKKSVRESRLLDNTHLKVRLAQDSSYSQVSDK